MDAETTRVDRAKLPVHLEETRIKPKLREVGAEERSRLQRLTLLTCALSKDQAAELLAGLSEELRLRARAELSELQRLDSADRQARVAVEFGPRRDAPERLRRLLAQAPSGLQRELVKAMAPYERTLFQGGVADPAGAQEAPAALCRFAERLVREASR